MITLYKGSTTPVVIRIAEDNKNYFDADFIFCFTSVSSKENYIINASDYSNCPESYSIFDINSSGMTTGEYNFNVFNVITRDWVDNVGIPIDFNTLKIDDLENLIPIYSGFAKVVETPVLPTFQPPSEDNKNIFFKY